MRKVEFHRLLDEENALRVHFDIEHGQVLKFVIQLESRFARQDNWNPVVRYDTAHGFAHCDRLHPYQSTLKTEMITQDYNEALTLAINDLITNWRFYRRRYEEWLLTQ